MEKVEKIQYQAAFAITGAWQGSSSRSKIYDELGWETLTDCRKCRRSLQAHKIINNSTLPLVIINNSTPPPPPSIINNSTLPLVIIINSTPPPLVLLIIVLSRSHA